MWVPLDWWMPQGGGGFLESLCKKKWGFCGKVQRDGCVGGYIWGERVQLRWIID